LKILGIDTSTTLFSICLWEDGRILYELKRERNFYKKSRDAGFFEGIKELLNSLNDERLDGIAIAIGPGMFTSLRVGLALAKGLHFSMNIPIYAVNTLEVIARSFPYFEHGGGDIICAPVIDASQKEFFVGFYNNKKSLTTNLILTPQGFLDFINNRFKNNLIVAIGPGVENLVNSKEIRDSKQIIILKSSTFFPSASKVVEVALPRIKRKKYDDPDVLEPQYVKKTSAEARLEG
jgi:tRNA threonylcarbamoyladenosine biosynthesis protein TsaB